MIGFRSFRKRGRSSAFLAMPTTSFRCVKFVDVLANVRIERFSIREDESDIDQLLACAGLVEAVETVGEPADGKRFAAARRMIGQILVPDIAGAGEVIGDVRRHVADQPRLMIAREQRKGRTRRFVFFRFSLRARGRERRRAPRAIALSITPRDRETRPGIRLGFCGVLVSPVLCQRKFSALRGSVATFTSVVSAAI